MLLNYKKMVSFQYFNIRQNKLKNHLNLSLTNTFGGNLIKIRTNKPTWLFTNRDYKLYNYYLFDYI